MSRLNNLYLFLNDEKGRTLPRAKLFFYENNSFDFKNTYADKALTSVNPNPVIADGAGRFPNIFLEADTYRVVLQDEDGVEISTKDDVDNLLSDGDNISNTTVTTSTGSQTVAGALDDRVVRVGSVAGLRALITSGLSDNAGARITATGRAGDFYWDSSDLSAEVTADTESGIYVAPDSDSTGASGAWVRNTSLKIITPTMCGATSGSDSLSALNAAKTLAKSEGLILTIDSEYLVSDTFNIDVSGIEVQFYKGARIKAASGFTAAFAFVVSESNVTITDFNLDGANEGVGSASGGFNYANSGKTISGLWMKGNTVVRNVQGNAFRLEAQAQVDNYYSTNNAQLGLGYTDFRCTPGSDLTVIGRVVQFETLGKGLAFEDVTGVKVDSFYFSNTIVFSADNLSNPLYFSDVTRVTIGEAYIYSQFGYGPKISRGSRNVTINKLYSNVGLFEALRIQGGSYSKIRNFELICRSSDAALKVEGHPLFNSDCIENRFYNGSAINESTGRAFYTEPSGTGTHRDNEFYNVYFEATGSENYGLGFSLGIPGTKLINCEFYDKYTGAAQNSFRLSDAEIVGGEYKSDQTGLSAIYCRTGDNAVRYLKIDAPSATHGTRNHPDASLRVMHSDFVTSGASHYSEGNYANIYIYHNVFNIQPNSAAGTTPGWNYDFNAVVP